MRNRNRGIVVGMGMLVLFAAVGTAFCQENAAYSESGLYVAGGAGIALVPEVTLSKHLKDGKVVTQANEGVFPNYMTYELGWSARAAVGFYIGDGTRAEAEFSYLFVGVKEISGLEKKDFEDVPLLTVVSVMVNGLYELETGSPLRPFVGLGVGPAITTLSAGKLKAAEPGSSPFDEADGWSAAYQATAGVGYEILDGFDVRLAYRFFHLPVRFLTYERKLKKDDPEYASYDTEIGTFPNISETTAHRIELGITYRFPPL